MSYLAVDAVRGARPDLKWLPLRRVATLRREPNTDGSSRLLALSSERGIEPRPEDGGRQLPSEATVNTYWRVHPNDLVFNPMWAIGGGVAVSGIAGAVSPAYRIYSPNSQVHPRFLHYVMRSGMAIDQYQLLVRGITTFDRSITREDLDGMPVPVPPLHEQRAIAEYLDRETGRIDALIAAKQRQVELLQQRWWAVFVSLVDQADTRRTPIRRALTSLTDGPFGSAFSSDDYVDDGPAVVRLGNIGFAEYRDEDQARIPRELYERFRGYAVAGGDLLIAGLGDERNHAGRACVAPTGLPPAIVKGKCFRARVDANRANAHYIALLLSSPIGAEAVGVFGRGSTRSMINLEVVKNTDIPLPSLKTQDEIVTATFGHRDAARRAASALSDQIVLLDERRKATITTAVTDEIHVPAAT